MDDYLKDIKFIEKKRRELLGLELVILSFLTIAVIVLSILEQKFLTLFFLGLLTTLFAAYIIDKEKKLKKINTHLTEEQFKNIEERVRTASLKEQLKEIGLLYRVGRVTVSSLTLQRKLNKILYIAFNSVKADRASIMLSNEKAGNFIIASSKGIDWSLFKPIPQKIEEGVAGWVCKNKTPIILSGKVDDERFKNFIIKSNDINSSISIPIKSKGKIIGVLNLSYLKGTKKVFTEHHMKILSLFARYISTTLDQAQHSHKKELIPS